MAVNSRFRTLAFALRGIVSDTYDMLNAVDAVMALDTDLTQEAVREAVEAVEHPANILSPDKNARLVWTDSGTCRWVFDHEYLVTKAKQSDEVLAFMRKNQKINAIKVLKESIPGLGLREAKEAVQDDRVSIHANLTPDPWSNF